MYFALACDIKICWKGGQGGVKGQPNYDNKIKIWWNVSKQNLLERDAGVPLTDVSVSTKKAFK